MNIREVLRDLFYDYCKGCRHSLRDVYGNMCLYSSPFYPLIPPHKMELSRNPTTHKLECNLFERKLK